MNILTIPKMILTPRDGWRDVEQAHPSLAHLLSSIVLPLSVLPPLLLYQAGTRYGEAFASGVGGRPWVTIAVVIYLAEVLTFLGMGWFIKQVAATHQVRTSAYDAYLLAAIAPTPLWLSSLALLAPDPALNAAAGFMALAASCILLYQGIYALGHMREGITAATITYTVMGAGLVAWTLLLLGLAAL